MTDMTDMNAIRVIPSTDIWSERFLAKDKHCGFKDLLLGKLSIPKMDKEIHKATDIGDKKSMIIKLNEITYTEPILLTDVKASSGKVAFNKIRRCKMKNYPPGNGAISWERLKNKYKPFPVPPMVELEKQFKFVEKRSGSGNLDHRIRRSLRQD
jgi:hypothetical protein